MQPQQIESEKRSEITVIYTTPTLKDTIKKEAQKRDMSANSFIIQCIKKEIDKEVG